jgi:S1-C subfamily serine protease
VAIAVREQTRGLKILVAAAIVVLGGLALGVFWNGQREGAKRDAEIKALLAANDRATHDFQVRLQASGDTTLMQAFKRRADSLERVVREAQERGAHEQAIQTLQRDRDLQRAFSTSDWPRVREANDPAVLFIYTEISDSGHSATGFNVTPNGRIVTNRHVVQSGSGARATRILVKFANTREWIAARIERIATEPMIDLAVIAIEKPDQKYPTVRGVSDSIDTPVGGPVSMIGYPLGTETPMEGMGTASFMARTTLTIGTISKVVPDLVQIDGYAGHGSSGSPVLDGRGRVIGVVWGGPTAAEGRIVFAVPSTRVLQLLNGGKP